MNGENALNHTSETRNKEVYDIMCVRLGIGKCTRDTIGIGNYTMS